MNRFKFNGKESQGDFGLGLLDYGARMYDSEGARWLTPDPLAEKYYPISPYAYVANNPVKFVGPDGEFFWAIFVGAAISVLTNGIDNILNDQGFFEGWGRAAIMGGIGGLSFGIGLAANQLTGFGKIAFQTGMHAHLGGMMSAANGGDYGIEALSGGFSSLAATGSGALLRGVRSKGWQAAGVAASGALTGGIAAEISGGDFWDGFRNGAISAGLNHAHEVIQDDRINWAKATDNEKVAAILNAYKKAAVNEQKYFDLRQVFKNIPKILTQQRGMANVDIGGIEMPVYFDLPTYENLQVSTEFEAQPYRSSNSVVNGVPKTGEWAGYQFPRYVPNASRPIPAMLLQVPVGNANNAFYNFLVR